MSPFTMVSVCVGGCGCGGGGVGVWEGCVRVCVGCGCVGGMCVWVCECRYGCGCVRACVHAYVGKQFTTECVRKISLVGGGGVVGGGGLACGRKYFF